MRVAIAGLGPKGLFALERLLDHAHDLAPRARLDIDIFEPHPAPGAGPVYDPDQPGYLRMNFAAAALDLWWPASRAAPRKRRLSFVEWRAARGGEDEDYPPRAEVGRYLGEGLETLLRCAPPNVEVRLHHAKVDSVRARGDAWQVDAAGAVREYDEVLIAVGHQDTSPTALAADWPHTTPLVPAVFPVERFLTRDRVPPGATVAIRGFALTFIDAALALTEGRGGSFEPLAGHPYRLRYVRGEDDAARILPSTRTGRPMLAKPGPGLTASTPELEHIAAEGRTRLTALPRPLDLQRDVEPILTAVATASLEAAGGRWGPAHDRSVDRPNDTRRECHLADPADSIEQSLAVGAVLVPPDRAWALGHAWRALYPAIVSQLGGDGLAAGDWPAFLLLAAEMERIAFGPPPVNAAKLLALIEDGRVDLTHLCGGEIVSRGGRALLRSGRGYEPVDVVVDAVLPGPGALGHGGLLADLIASGHARVVPGRRGLDVTGDGTCRGLDGSLSSGLSAIGRPTEDSVIGNDTLSRGLHPHADRWAERIVLRSREHARRRHPGARGGAGMSVRGGCEGVVALPARLEPWQERLCAEPALLAEWIETYGSPLNVIDPAPLARNAAELQDVADEVGVDFRIFFARKANKALALVDEAVRHGLGVDVASERELQQVLDRGVPAADVVVTAAVKPRALLELCAASGATVVIDNEDELRLLLEVAAGGSPVPVALRLGPALGGRPFTRFGLAPLEMIALLDHYWPTGGVTPLTITGVHFHLDGYAAAHRVTALTEAIAVVEELRGRGHHPTFVDMGGGIPMSYLDDATAWDEFWSEHRAGLLGTREPLTFGGHGLGLIAHAGEIIGRPNVYPYFQRSTRGAWLARILEAEVTTGAGRQTIAEALRTRGLQLRCEPGRSLVDGCGLTAARVEFRKQSRDGTWLIGAAMNRTQCRSTSDDFLVDPLLLRAHDAESASTGPIEGYLVGAYCIERELLTWRRLRFPDGVDVGDIVVFPNTAGYLMHILESASHQIPLARNLVVGAGSEPSLDAIDEALTRAGSESPG